MSRILFVTVISLILFSCSSKTGKKFFEYDGIIYYSNNFDGSKLQYLLESQSKSANDSLKLNVILGNTPKDISDLSFIDKLEEIGYSKKIVDKSKFADIDKIFREKFIDEGLSTACAPIYRDILLFKRQKKVVGMAKVCFECMAHQIAGTRANTDNFGQEGDYSRLQKILRE